jgi:hypothetical protein
MRCGDLGILWGGNGEDAEYKHSKEVKLVTTCIRKGNTYKRHKFKHGLCKCGAQQVEHRRAVANRRERRRAARAAAKLTIPVVGLGAGTGV